MAEQRSVPDYNDPGTGKDPSKWDQKTVSDCPQRGRQPQKLDLSPEDSDFYTKDDWKDPIGAQHCQEDYQDYGHNPLNQPVAQRTKVPPPDGWETIASDTYSEGENFGPGRGGEKR